MARHAFVKEIMLNAQTSSEWKFQFSIESTIQMCFSLIKTDEAQLHCNYDYHDDGANFESMPFNRIT